MESNKVFKVTPNEYKNITKDISKKFEIQPKQVKSRSIVESFEVKPKGGKITFTFYKSNKLMI